MEPPVVEAKVVLLGNSGVEDLTTFSLFFLLFLAQFWYASYRSGGQDELGVEIHPPDLLR